MKLEEARIIELPKITNVRGNLTFIEGGRQVPFCSPSYLAIALFVSIKLRIVFFMPSRNGVETRKPSSLRALVKSIAYRQSWPGRSATKLICSA